MGNDEGEGNAHATKCGGHGVDVGARDTNEGR